MKDNCCPEEPMQDNCCGEAQISQDDICLGCGNHAVAIETVKSMVNFPH